MTKAKAFVALLTIDEKVNLTTGVGILGRYVVFTNIHQYISYRMIRRCLGNTGAVPRLNFTGFCFEDSPTGVKNTDFVSVFPSTLNVASTFDRGLMYSRAAAMGAEFRGKGVNVA